MTSGWIVTRVPDQLPLVQAIEIQKLTASNVTYTEYGAPKRVKLSSTAVVFTDKKALKAFVKPLVEARIKKLEDELKEARKRRKNYPVRTVRTEPIPRPTNF